MKIDIKVFVISLVQRKDRLDLILNDLSKIDCNVEVIKAVDGYELEIDDIPPVTFAFRPMFRGEIGCLFSHKAIWKRMVEENMKEAIIIEDDADLSDAGIVQELIEEIEKDRNDDSLDVSMFGFNNAELVKVDRRGRIIDRFGFGSHCYLIKLDGAKKMLEFTEEVIPSPVDILLQMLRDRCKTHPFLVRQRRNVSDTQPKTDSDDAFWWKLVTE